MRLKVFFFFLTALFDVLASAATIDFASVVLDDKSKTVIDYAAVTPPQIDLEKVILFLPPGAQNREAVEKGLAPWAEGLKKAGYSIFAPVAPGGVLFYEGSERFVPQLVRKLRQRYKLEREQLYLLGLSNGGISAFRVAVQSPKLWRGMIVAPGFAKPVDEKKLDRLGNIPVTFFVGAQDGPWLKKANEMVLGLRRLKQQGEVRIIGSAGHKVYEKVPVEQVLQALGQPR